MPSRKHRPELAALIAGTALLATGAAGGWAVPIFGLAAAGARLAAYLLAIRKRGKVPREPGVEERIRIIREELEQARRLDTGSVPRKHVA
ncbi:MAG: hypothetical protein HY874_11995 [Chloroflexi bacterium]|nr:hypothetical protein [Chloroflexota bacterium]